VYGWKKIIMNKTTNQKIINAIKVWQTNPFLHPLTCGNDSRHRNLEPFDDNGIIKLKCIDCDYIQDFIPECVSEFKH
jgi:hypothetical protein